MKRIGQFLILSITVLFVSFNLKGQCTVDAGPDTSLCVLNGLDSNGFHLGQNLVVTGGLPPYSYTWSCTYSLGSWSSVVFTAESFLDSTTIANPELTSYYGDSLVFYLTVTDSLGATCSDSIVVGFCNFAFLMGEKRAYIDRGDSTQLYLHTLGSAACTDLSYEWTPNYNISDTSIRNPVAWPDTTTFYSVKITTGGGCVVYDAWSQVYVARTSVVEQEKSVEIELFPNPMEGYSIFRVSEEVRKAHPTLAFYDALGRCVKRIEVKGLSTKVLRSSFDAGVYFYRLTDGGKVIGTGKLVVQ